MTLRELKQMIAEEYAAFKRTRKRKNLNEQPAGLPDLPDLPGISVSDDDVDATGGGGDAEGALKDIQGIVDKFFAADEDDAADDTADDADDADDADVEKDDEEDEADLEEITNHGVGKSAKKSSGPNAGYGKAKSSKGDGKLHESRKRAKKPLPRKPRKLSRTRKKSSIIENKILTDRFKKLANIK